MDMDLDMGDEATGQHLALERDAQWDLSAAAVLAAARGDARTVDLVTAAKKMYDLAARARKSNQLPWPRVSLEDDMARVERAVAGQSVLCCVKGSIWGEAAMLMMSLATAASSALN